MIVAPRGRAPRVPPRGPTQSQLDLSPSVSCLRARSPRLSDGPGRASELRAHAQLRFLTHAIACSH
eukprot:751109-Hanusia_phi.AAC.1